MCLIVVTHLQSPIFLVGKFSPGDFAKLIADETSKWAKVIRAANIKAD
jgi:hypothetical protein